MATITPTNYVLELSEEELQVVKLLLGVCLPMNPVVTNLAITLDTVGREADYTRVQFCSRDGDDSDITPVDLNILPE